MAGNPAHAKVTRAGPQPLDTKVPKGLQRGRRRGGMTLSQARRKALNQRRDALKARPRPARLKRFVRNAPVPCHGRLVRTGSAFQGSRRELGWGARRHRGALLASDVGLVCARSCALSIALVGDQCLRRRCGRRSACSGWCGRTGGWHDCDRMAASPNNRARERRARSVRGDNRSLCCVGLNSGRPNRVRDCGLLR